MLQKVFNLPDVVIVHNWCKAGRQGGNHRQRPHNRDIFVTHKFEILIEEDLDLDSYINNYVKTQPEEFETLLGSYINDYFLKSVQWVCNEGEIGIPCSKIAVAKTGLSQLFEVGSKSQFAVALINGLGQQLQCDFRELFAQQIYDCKGKRKRLLTSFWSHLMQELYQNIRAPLVRLEQVQIFEI